MFEDQPHPQYMSKNHPIRSALGKSSMPLFQPYAAVWAGGEAKVNQESVTPSIILNTMIHETYHIYDGNVRAEFNPESTPFLGPETKDKEFLAALDNEEFQRLIFGYYDSVVEITKLSGGNLTKAQVEQSQGIKLIFGRLASIVKTMRQKFNDAYNGYINWEYVEGLTEFVAAQSMIDAGLQSFSEQLRVELENPYFDELEIYYKTGAFGGFVMRQLVGNFDWQIGWGYHGSGIWERLMEIPSNIDPMSLTELQPYLNGLAPEAIQMRVRKLKTLAERFE